MNEKTVNDALDPAWWLVEQGYDLEKTWHQLPVGKGGQPEKTIIYSARHSETGRRYGNYCHPSDQCTDSEVWELIAKGVAAGL